MNKNKKYCYGYGWRLSSETMSQAFENNYGIENLNASLKEAKKDFKDQLDGEAISKSVRPKFFRLVLESVNT